MSIKKILFPFLNPHHTSLFRMIWFRFTIVLYVIMIAVLLAIIWIKLSHFLWGWCYDTLGLFSGMNDFDKQFYQCLGIRNTEFKIALFGTLLLTVLTHYLIQFTFFKIVIDFIVLGRSFKSNR